MNGLAQAVKAAPSMLHRKLALESVSEKPKLGCTTLLGLVGLLSMDGAGGAVVFTSQL